MSTTETADLVNVTSGLYRFMVASEATLTAGRRLADDAQEQLRERARRLAQRFNDAKQTAGTAYDERVAGVQASLRSLAAALDEHRPQMDDLRQRWQALGRDYESLLSSIKRSRVAIPRGTRLPELRPRNYNRNIFHVTMGVGLAAIYQFLLPRSVLIPIGVATFALMIFMDLLRRVSPKWNDRFMEKVFSKISRPAEAHKVPSAVWYTAGLVLGVILMPQAAIIMGALVLAIGDPVASLVGKRWGQVKLFREKSYVGTAAFFTVTLLVGGLYLWLIAPGIGLTRGLGIATAVAAAGAATELLSLKVDDNFSIPLVAGFVATLLL